MEILLAGLHRLLICHGSRAEKLLCQWAMWLVVLDTKRCAYCVSESTSSPSSTSYLVMLYGGEQSVSQRLISYEQGRSDIRLLVRATDGEEGRSPRAAKQVS